MDIRRRGISATYISLLYITLAVGSLINEARDVAMMEPERLRETPEMQMISPVDNCLLQERYLNIWRDVRTINDVVRHNRAPRVYVERMQALGPKLLKINPSKGQTAAINRDALRWAESKPHRHLAVVTYYLIEVLKAHSPQNTHKDIERLAEGISDISKFNYPRKGARARQMVLEFMDEKMSQIGLHLLMEGLSKALNVDRRVGIDSLTSSRTYDLKNLIPEADLAEYVEHYQRYMNLIGSLEILAGAGIENRNVIRTVNAKTPLNDARKVFSEESSQPRLVHRYLINAEPHDKFQPLVPPIFGYGVTMEDPSSSQIEATVRELWKSSGQDDISLAYRLANPTSISGGRIYCPERLRHSRGYRALTDKYRTDDPLYDHMWQRVARNVIDVIGLKEKDAEEQSMLWRILGSAFIISSKDFSPEKFERHVENSIMFYMLIRRIGEVLAKAVEIHFPATPSEGRVIRSQFMNYYWSLVTYKSTGEKNKRAKTILGMQFALGRVYLNHLISSQKFKDLYNRMRLSHVAGPQSLIVLDQEEEAMLPRSSIVKEVERRITGKRTHPQTQARNIGDGMVTLQQASKSSPSSRTVVLDRNRDRLNFKIPRKKSSRYPHSITSNIASLDENAISHTVLQPAAKKRKSVAEGVVGMDKHIPEGLEKKPSTETAISSSPKGSGSQFPIQDAGPTTPSIDGTQNTPHHAHSVFQALSQESKTDERPSSIQPVSGGTSPPSSKHIPSLDLNRPPNYSGDDDVHMMLPDLNEPLYPGSPQDDIRNMAPDILMHPSVSHQNGGVPAQHTSSPRVTSREEIPDLNI